MILDNDLEMARKYMKSKVLDLGGGRRRSEFKEPEDATFIVLDINRDFQPAVLGDAHHLPFTGSAFDCVKCTELLEHVENPEKVVEEITRVLKPSGTLILSMPFNFGIHADPFDFQRFTDYKLRKMLEKDFEIEIIKKQGLYFTVLGHMIKQAITNMKSKFKRIFYLTFPLLDLLVKLDNRNFVKNSKYLSSFTTGFFVIARKEVSHD
jgi:ubiquinone/menaquinone biosynthesis C-methylase UbiE